MIGLAILVGGYKWVVADKSSGEIYKNKNYYDVLFVGTSMTVANVSNEELYLEYGIAGANVGKSSQFVYLSYYALEEALKYQNPQAVLFDVSAMFYSEETQKNLISASEYTYVHGTLDGMKNNRTKYEAFCQTKELHEDSSFWDYFSALYYYHSNWQSLSQKKFQSNANEEMMNGNHMAVKLYEGYGRTASIWETENDGTQAEIDAINYEYFNKIVELCRKNDVQLILLYSAVRENWDWTQYNAINNLAEKYELDYLDVNILQEDAEISWATDMQDTRHFNVCGAKKWTDYIGKYLNDSYEFADRREDARYQVYAEQEGRYNDSLEAMETYNALNSAATLGEYLEQLQQIDLEDNIVIVVSDTLSFDMSEENYEKFKGLGSTVQLDNNDFIRYAGIMTDNGITEMQDSEVVNMTEQVQGIEVSIKSGTYESPATIKIDGDNQLNAGAGINFFVYNVPRKKVLSSVFFNTDASEEPEVWRIKDIGTMAIQMQGEGNTWTTIGYE